VAINSSPVAFAHAPPRAPVDLAGRVSGNEIGLRTGDFTTYPQEVLEVAVAERVMHHASGALGVLRRRTDDVHHGYMLGVMPATALAADNSPTRTWSPAPPCRAAGHSVSGIAGVEFIGAANQRIRGWARM